MRDLNRWWPTLLMIKMDRNIPPGIFPRAATPGDQQASWLARTIAVVRAYE
jgi:hypothetical protein